MFLLEGGELMLNEVAPRPHNSGHYTIEACGVSQFEQHLRAILGLPLGDPSLKVGSRWTSSSSPCSPGCAGHHCWHRPWRPGDLLHGGCVCSIMLNVLGEDEGEAGSNAAKLLLNEAYATEGGGIHF